MVYVPSDKVLAALLEYEEARKEGREVSVNSLAKRHGIPATTLYRWVKKYEAGEISLGDLVKMTAENKDLDDPAPSGGEVDVDSEKRTDIDSLDGLVEEEIERMGKSFGEPYEETSFKVSAMPRSVYAQLEQDSMLALTSMAFLYGYNDVNEFVKKQVLPLLRMVKRLEDRFNIRIDPDRFYEGFLRMMDDAARSKALLEFIKRMIERGGVP